MDKAPRPDLAPILDDEEPETDAQIVSEALMNELVKLRKKRKISQVPIAKAIGVTQARVSQIENLKGGVTLEAVLVYAQAIGATIVVVPDKPPKSKKTPE